MEEGFRWCLVLGGPGGEIALVIHSQYLQQLIQPKQIVHRREYITLVSNDLLKSVTLKIQDAGFHQISVVGEERALVVSHSLKLGYC